MKIKFRSIVISFIAACVLSCNGQVEASQVSAEKSEPVTVKIEMPKYGFSSGLVDHEGNLWFASNGGGIFYFDGKTFTNYTEKNGLGSNKVFSILEDKDYNLWFGTEKGLTKYNKNQFENIPLPFQDTTGVWLDQVYPIINPNAVHVLIQDQKGDFWLGTGGGGAYRYNGKVFTSFLTSEGMKYEDSLYHNWIPDIAEDKNGNIWFASMSYGGLTQYDGKAFKRYSTKDGLSDDMIRKILVDKAGNLWLGFNGNRNSALTVYNGESFGIFSLEDNACHRSIRGMYIGENEKLWLVGEGGICILSENKFSEFLNNDEQPFSGLNFVMGDNEQNVWFGGRNGLWKFDGVEVTELTR